jgi:amidase
LEKLRNVDRLLTAGSIESIGSAFRIGQLLIEDAAAWFLQRIAAFNHGTKNLNAIRTVSSAVLDDAKRLSRELQQGNDRGALHGIPVLLKDNILAVGMTASAGAAALAEFTPSRDALIVQKLRVAGALILGKTNMTEFADYVSDVMPSGFSGAGGVVANPHGIAYDRGQGSSVGSAAAVAASFAVFAIGTETQNSIQTPAGYTSVVGYKPTVGLVGRSGIIPLVPSQDTPGTLCRSVADATLVVEAIAGPDGRDLLSMLPDRTASFSGLNSGIEGVRIGVPRRCQADRMEFGRVMENFENALSRLSAAGAVIVDPCDLPSAEQLQDVRSSVFRCEFRNALNVFLEENGSPCGLRSLEDIIAWNTAHPDHIPYGQSLLLAANETSLDARYIQDRRRDVVLSGTAGIDAALTLGDVDVLIAPMGAAAKCTGKAGSPVVAIPAGLDATGAPFGVTVYARKGDDRRLLAAAVAIEREIGDRREPVL